MGFWEVIRSWRWSPYEWNCALIKENTENSLPFLSFEDTMKRRQSINWRGLSPEPNYNGTLIRILVSRTVRNKLALYKPCSLWYCIVTTCTEKTETEKLFEKLMTIWKTSQIWGIKWATRFKELKKFQPGWTWRVLHREHYNQTVRSKI